MELLLMRRLNCILGHYTSPARLKKQADGKPSSHRQGTLHGCLDRISSDPHSLVDWGGSTRARDDEIVHELEFTITLSLERGVLRLS